MGNLINTFLFTNEDALDLLYAANMIGTLSETNMEF